jgi:hypothetical protein
VTSIFDHPIPFAALDGKVGIMGLTGSGKTFTAIGLVELLLGAGRQVIVVDPTGVYNGLRTAFPVPIFGGKFGDVEIGEDSGDAVARLIIARNMSAIVDVSLLLKKSHAAARRFMRPFVAALKDAPTAARYLVMDEVDEFMPENANGDVAQLFGDLKWIVRRGRSEGWRMLMVTQRPQDIAKSVLTQCETMVIHRLTAPQDRKALMEWVKGNADADVAKDVLASMAKLETGEAWVWSPAHNLLERVMMPLNRSEDRSKTPDADDTPRAMQGFKPVDLQGIRDALTLSDQLENCADATAPAKLTDHTQCQAQIAALTKQLAKVTDDERKQRSNYAWAYKQRDLLLGAINRSGEIMVEVLKKTVAEMPLYAPPSSDTQADKPFTELPLPNEVKPQALAALQSSASMDVELLKKTGGATPAALAIVALLDRINPAKLTWAQACAMTGRKASGGNFNSSRKWLRESGRIHEEGDFIWSANAAPAGLTNLEAFDLWHSILSNPAPRMMVVLQSGARNREGLAQALSCAPRGGNWNNGLAQLRRNGVITETDGFLALANPLPGASE